MKENDFCLDDVPFGLKLARPRKLEEDARRYLSNYVRDIYYAKYLHGKGGGEWPLGKN